MAEEKETQTPHQSSTGDGRVDNKLASGDRPRDHPWLAFATLVAANATAEVIMLWGNRVAARRRRFDADQSSRFLRPEVHDDRYAEAAQEKASPIQRGPRPAYLLAKQFRNFNWTQTILFFLGIWLLTSTATFAYGSPLLAYHDLATGLLLMSLSAFAARRKRAWYRYAETLVGVWLLFAPLAFWAPTSVVYANHTLVGIAVVFFSVLLPSCQPMPGSQIPTGWSYNPSSWPQRAPIILLGLVGFFVSRYMAGFQLGYISSVWDPFFGNGTEAVLDSEVSHWFLVSDAGLGAMVYLVDSLSAVGDERRWRTTPWMVAVLAVAAIPAGMVSIVLVILQATVVRVWCTLCLVQTAVTLAIIAFALDEIAASAQFLYRSGKRGESLWKTFWLGGDLPQGEGEVFPRRDPAWMIAAMSWGTSSPWNLWATAAIGAWVMFSPDLFNLQEGLGSNAIHGAGILAVVFSVVALSELARPLRWINVVIGGGLIIGTWFLGVETWTAQISHVLSGLLLIACSWRRGPIHQCYGGLLKSERA